MVQAVMYFALGLLTAGLLAILVTPAIWRRAIRLTRQRIERSVPMTLAEIEADKDQLRAEYAMSSRRLEMNTERLREKTTEQVIEINRKRAEIVRLSNQVGDQAEANEALTEKLAKLEADHAVAVENLRAARELIARHEADLADRIARIGRLESLLAAADQLTAEQKLELAANATDIANLTDRLDDTTATLATVTAERDRLTASLAAEQAALAAERRRGANLEASLARIEAERTSRLAELEQRGGDLAGSRARPEGISARIADLQAARDQGRAETQGAESRLRDELEARNTEIAALKAEVADLSAFAEAPPLAPSEQQVGGDNIAKAIAAAEAERAELLARLNSAEAANQALAAENAELRRSSGADASTEQENALLRDRLAQIAADVVRLGQNLPEGGQEGPVAANGGNGHADDNGTRAEAAVETAPATETAIGGETKPLAERLRALQHTAARH